MFEFGDNYEFIYVIWNWLTDLFYGFVYAGSWFTSPLIDLGGFTFTPITLLSFAGITAFIGVAVVKWATV